MKKLPTWKAVHWSFSMYSEVIDDKIEVINCKSQQKCQEMYFVL